MRYYFIVNRMTKIRQTVTSLQEDVEKWESFLLFGICNCAITLENSLAVLQYVKELLCDSANPLLGVYPKEVKTSPHKSMSMNLQNSIMQGSQKK